MISLLENSVYIGVFLSIATFWLGMYLQQKFRSPVLNPLLVSTVLMIGFIKFTGYDYATMDRSLQYINYLLTPATICLAVPLYEQMKTLKNNMSAIFLGIFSGVLSSLVSIFLLCVLFGFDHAAYVTLLPKSITTPIGMGISQKKRIALLSAVRFLLFPVLRNISVRPFLTRTGSQMDAVFIEADIFRIVFA